MQTITVGEFGIKYLSKCLEAYFEGYAYLFLMLLVLLCILLWGSELEKKIFLPPSLCLLLTIFNPIVPVVMNHIFDVNKEYYRFFWIAPIVIIIAFGAVKVVLLQKGALKYIVSIALIVLIVATGRFVYAQGYIKSPNIYKMPDEIIEISEMIHNDSKGEYPRAIFEYDYEMSIRQYDPKILLTIGRDEYINAISGYVTLDDVYSDENHYNKVLYVVALHTPIDEEDFIKGLTETNTRYVVVTTDERVMCPYLEHAGLRLVGSTQNHSVYCYDSEAITDWELPDYSDVWENY